MMLGGPEVIFEVREPKEMSDWRCWISGNPDSPDGAVVWNVSKEHEPNWFWRKMHFLMFGFQWVKK